MSHPIQYRCFKVPKESINLLKGILECYEGMCILSTVDREQGIVQTTVPTDFIEEMSGVIDEIRERIPMHEVYHEINHSLGLF